MTNPVEAILFDMGGTLRSTVRKSKTEIEALIRRILKLIDYDAPVDEFAALLEARAAAYRGWARTTMVELNEADLWTKWMLPDRPTDQVRGLAVQLNQLYREATGTRIIFSETQDVLLELFRRGYRLGLVSNTTSSSEVPAALAEMHLAGCFETVILSTVVGKRKPDPAILLEATQRMSIAPGKCAYVGDRVNPDVAVARKAGFSRAIILRNPSQPVPEEVHSPSLAPDAVIADLTGLLEIFPRRSAPRPAAVYDASLSTMWAMQNFPSLADFFEAARRMGFARIELNHKVTTLMLGSLDLSRQQFSSVHEPCPADISEQELKKRDWLISSLDEACRVEGVRAIKRSIDMADRTGAGAVVIHAGQSAHGPGKPETELRALLAAGRQGSDEYRAIQAGMIRFRAEHAPASFASVEKSISELLAHAGQRGIRLGLENRYHYFEHPSPDELQLLLALAGPDRIGMIFDLGHAEALSRLGFYPRSEWLERFAPRIIGTHLHDIDGTTDHLVPGGGDADFSSLAASLPENAFRTCEFQAHNTPEQVRAGLRFLQEHGCIRYLGTS
jgi:HAD superfamily hydrolase (TIGR01549 family)